MVSYGCCPNAPEELDWRLSGAMVTTMARAGDGSKFTLW